MASLNRVIFIGHLTRDPDQRYLDSGAAVADLRLAINDRVKCGDEWISAPTFLDVTLWRRNAEIAQQHLRKGSAVLIEGRLKTDEWETDGQKRFKLKVVADRMQMLGPTKGKANGDGANDPPVNGAEPNHVPF